MLTREQALDEARRQKEALATIAKWRRVLFILTSCLLPVALYGLQGAGGRFVAGIIAAAAGVLCLIMAFIVNLSIRNGHRNVEKILDSLS